MNNIRDIRIVQYYRKGTEMYKGEDERIYVREVKEFTHHKFQIKRDSFGADWEDIEVLEIEEQVDGQE